jgi:hypothetical protein
MCGSCYYLLLVSSHKHEKQKDQRGRGERRSMLLKTKNPSFIIRSYIYLLQAYYKSQAPRCCIQVILFTCIIRTVRYFTCIIRTVHLFCIHGNSHHNMLLI